MWPKIDKELLPMKAHYFFFNAGTAPVMPFMPTLARQLGFSTVVVGTMYAILPIVGMLAKPLFGFIADRYQRHRTLFLIGEVLTAVAFFLIQFTPSIPQSLPTVEFHCHGGASDLKYYSEFDKCIEQNLESYYGDRVLTCQLYCQANPEQWDFVCDNWLHNNSAGSITSNVTCPDRNNPQLNFTTFVNMSEIVMASDHLFFVIPHDQGQINGENITLNCPREQSQFNTSCQIECNDKYFHSQLVQSAAIKNSDVTGMYQFWYFFIMLIVSWIGMAVVVSIGDAICFSILGERHHLYGNQRLCGSIGFGVFSIIAGVLVDKMSGGSATKDYTIVFWMTLVIIGFDLISSTKLKHTQTHLSPNILKDVGKMFLSVRCVIFFIWCVSIGLCTALVWNFLFMHLDELGEKLEGCQNSMKTLEGFAMGIQCFGGELPFFFLSGWILRKIGHVNAMSLVLFAFGVRFILYSVLVNPWYVLPIEMLNGVTFGIFYSTMASYASIVAPPGTEATMQGLVGAVFEGVGVSMGSLIAGNLFAAVSGSGTFLIFGIFAFIVFVVHVCVQIYLQRNAVDTNGKQTEVNNVAHEVNYLPAENGYIWTVNAKTPKGVNAEFTDVDLS
ncbi:PREDICTED: major facilitator superfamily domain-containing protein 6-like protein A isoform X1 [Rhagoletis zephyria]|uniref:major facilitator superfamily domain-containing protein 6-like protein A isoform X1 n=1 Tax=Rhagoletis zephyria TaxID=28612 RepID=UPI00081181B0|nr:PREDICTED: major facilitator superfamily domain-containing protein 6-like protein A isoform X1 [Rhagoletis zephyria]XP_017482718.1 PREDICTED: major facilitator superfamily domain-containing protein 6-like protein A isoform X1 [Rhagoletis zephyria]XP_017482719.1 PREDICTED: major facilitator superfamily domain-containing protein 6-like protein A isoform X1 [Rhagoletis zephyria]XP_017482720.1 PREDICTED: major facilitator superfamily domain-containing protein 6-like protein A isoform X1 [Rhagolet